ncbi:MAG: efflux RND transporter periplasmic adaptor subunit, partial [Nitrospirales bacterium]
TVKDLSRLRITVAVPESEVAWISHDTPVEIDLDARPGERYSGVVTRYASALDPETRTMATEIQIDNPDSRLYPGMYAHVRFILESRQGRLTVPQQAVQEMEGGREVWIVDEGIVKAVPIRTEYADAIVVEVTEGLAGSEDVIVQGRHRVRPGDPVTIYSATRRQKAPGPVPASAGKE